MKMKFTVSVIVALVSTSIFGSEAEELQRIRAALTNKALARGEEYNALWMKHRDAIPGIRSRLNGVELLLTFSFVESVAATPTNVIIRTTSSEDIASGWKIEPNAEIILTPDKETVFASVFGGGVILSPASFKNKQKGFRVKSGTPGPKIYNQEALIYIAYIALSDTPVEVREDDVEMVMEGGAWVTAEEARKNLELEKLSVKLGPRAFMLMQRAEEIQRNPKLMAEVLEHPDLLGEWKDLIEAGYIKTNAADTASSASERSNLNNLWLYVGVSLCALCAILYFLRGN